MINVKKIDQNKIRTDEKSKENILFSALDMRRSKTLATRQRKEWSLFTKKKEINGNKYLTLVSTDENKDTLNKYEELWGKVKGLIGPR